MTRHVIVGKGAIGATLAQHLADAGQEVLVVSRSGATGELGRDAERAGIRHVALDASDPAALGGAARGADVLYNCLNPAYDRWPTDWPPLANALLTAAEDTGAVLVTAGNLYGYGAGTQLMREDSPLATTETKGSVRVAMWREAERRHRAGRLRATEVRGSDYLGPRALGAAHAGSRMLQPLLAGKTLRPIGAADVPHTWTYLPDFARALASAGSTEAAWGAAWHVPSHDALTFRELATRFAAAAGVPAPRIRPLPLAAVRALGVVSPMLREIAAMGYQFVEPFVMESAQSRRVLGVAPTPWDTLVAETLAWWRGRSGSAPASARA
jgi:nucleoside-diphosphate-sugar epimerase